MCDPVTATVMLVAATGVSVMGQMQQAQAAKDAANAQAQAIGVQTGIQMDAAKAQAERVRKLGRAQRGEANAALAASGVKLGEGTPLEINKSIIQNSEQDALSSILNGKRIGDAGAAEMAATRKAGQAAYTNGMYGAASTALSAGGTYARGGWKMVN